MAKSRLVAPLSILLFMVLILIFPAYYMESARKSLGVFATSVLPALFPFVFLTTVLTKTGIVEDVARVFEMPFKKLFGVCPLGAYVVFSALVCGYPVGAITLSSLYENGSLSTEDVKRIVPISSMVGPVFVLGTLGSVLGDGRIAVIVLASHYVATLLNGVLWKGVNNSRLSRARTRDNKIKGAWELKNQTELQSLRSSNNLSIAPISTAIGDSVSRTALSMLSVGGYILLGGLLVDTISLVPALYSLPNEFGAITYGLIEMTRGVIASQGITSITLKTAVATFVVTLGGVSVALQSHHFLSRCGVTIFDIILPKITQGIMAFLTAEIFSNLFFNILA